MHAEGRADLAALSRPAARLDMNLRWRPVRTDGAGMLIANGESRMTTVIRVSGETFTAEVEPGQPPVGLAPVDAPDTAAARVASMPAPAATA